MPKPRPAHGRRCICGRSARYPLCDDSHRTAGWRCVTSTVERVQYAFVGSPHLQNLADRLAHRFGGTSMHALDGRVRATVLVVVTDGVGHASVRTHMEAVHADETLVIGVGLDENMLSWAFPGARIAPIADGSGTTVWDRAQACIEGGGARLVPVSRPRIFLSHGVNDESRIFPALSTLRTEYGLEIFVCADSIRPGADWQEEIRDHLRRCDLFVVLSSKAASSSVFCAFEAGMAVGLEKPTRLVDLDGGPLPSHLRGIQAISLPRLRVRKPWLTEGDALVDALLWTIHA